jgi:DeoR/GlpR family transcriptional regulator of sugar metabolism
MRSSAPLRSPRVRVALTWLSGMTNKKYSHLNRVSPATAQRDLAELVARGVLRAQGGGRSVRYDLAD